LSLAPGPCVPHSAAQGAHQQDAALVE
jgi:hypothetical protein